MTTSTVPSARSSAADVQHQLLRAREFCLLGDYDNGLPEFRRVLQVVQRQCVARVNAPGVQQVRAYTLSLSACLLSVVNYHTMTGACMDV